MKPLVFLTRTVGDTKSNAHVAHDARDDHAVARCRLHVAIDRGRARDRVEHLARKLRVDERSQENARGDTRGRSHTARGNVVDLEEALCEAAAEDEADMPSRLGVVDSQSWPKNGAGLAATSGMNHGFCGPVMPIDVSSDGSNRPGGGEGNRRKRGVCKSSYERAHACHAGSVAARQDDRLGSLLAYVDGRAFEVVEIPRLVNTRSVSGGHVCERVEKAIGLLQASRVAVEDDVDAPSHGAAGLAPDVETGYVRGMKTTVARRASVCAVGLATSVLAGAGCASSPAMRAAERGDQVVLRDILEKQEKAGALSNGQASWLAGAVAARDVRVASSTDAVLRVRELQSCARELDDVLADRMRTRDEAGAHAALARIESGRLDLDSAREMLSDPSPAWRAVGTRGLVRPKDRPARLAALLDPEPAVRRQAARAARDTADASDLDALAETARVDPEPLVRTEAVRAIAVLPPVAGSRTAHLLSDLWTVGDDGLREDIARAWSSASVWSAGGRGALENVIASEHGPGVIEAAAAVLARSGPVDDLSNLAAAEIARSMASGSEVTRLQALAEAPLSNPDLLSAVKAASHDDDRAVRIAALGRLAEQDRAAMEELESLARPGQRLGSRARLALAFAGDRRVQAWIEADLEAPAPAERLAAVTGLAALGLAARGAPLLADEDASVRDRAACTLVMASRIAR